MFSALTYFFDHSIYFARLHHVNPLCKHKYAFLQMKEAPNQKVQEKKPLLKFKNTKKYMCLERIWRTKCVRACRHRPLLGVAWEFLWLEMCSVEMAPARSSQSRPPPPTKFYLSTSSGRKKVCRYKRSAAPESDVKVH